MSRAPAAFVLASGLFFGSVLLGCGGCGKSTSVGATLPDGARIVDASAPVAVLPQASDPTLADLWRRALKGDADDLARLADREGEDGLVERGRAEVDPNVRLTAVRAMAYAPEPGALAGLPFLAEVARGADDAQALAALESAVDVAARPRRQVDPEDAAEMKEGCDAMVGLASDVKAARARRVLALRALRMLADRGCVDAASLPTDLDAR